MKVLFVCSGNICRSPMAEAYFRELAARSGLSHVVVGSAGTLGIEDAPASEEAIEVMREIGIDLGEHRSRGVTPADARTSDLVVAMAHDHLAWLALHYPDAGGERVLVRAFDAGPQPAIDADDLPDPIGRSLRFYRQQRDRLVRALDHLALHLKHHG